MDFHTAFKNFISQQNLFSPKDKLLLAISGGMDSVVLCELCHQAGFDFAIAHCNFQLRGDESDRDENFVKQLAEKYNRQLFIKKFDTEKYAANHKLSVQVAARELRYGWFNEIVNGQWSMVNREEKYQPSIHHSPFTIHHIATAHHLDDNIETVLMNFFKGTGIAGLHGILPKHGKIVRPLLFATKEELKQFAVANNLQWVEDSSNESDKYSRNYFRHQVIPRIEKIYPGAINNLYSNISRFRDIEILYQLSILEHKKKLL
jgi:tRNA(Ile)-lysidine synthase